ncbi:hypothetical protein B0H14DRAFT_2823706, partial [Mycena olivaceomarginata]
MRMGRLASAASLLTLLQGTTTAVSRRPGRAKRGASAAGTRRGWSSGSAGPRRIRSSGRLGARMWCQCQYGLAGRLRRLVL